MLIHTVRPQDTIFKIAREYSTSPMKIIENNSLENPDRLTVGEKLLILTPTRTYTVRGGDTLGRIADRFGVSVDSIRKNNPSLCGTDKIYPGQLLALKYDCPRYGVAGVNGYLTRGVDMNRLSYVLPHISHLTVPAFKWNGERLDPIMNTDTVVARAKEENVLPLMRIYDATDSLFGRDKLLDKAILTAKEKGFAGVTLAAYPHMKKLPAEHGEMLMNLRRRAMEEDLLIFSEVDGNSAIPDIGDYADGYALMYERVNQKNIPNMGLGEETLISKTSEIFEPSKTYMEIPSSGYMGDESVQISDIYKLAERSGRNIEYDTDLGICWFDYTKYKAGRKATNEITWESLESIKAKLDLVGELGLMGITVDIGQVPTEYLMMYETMFRPVPTYR